MTSMKTVLYLFIKEIVQEKPRTKEIAPEIIV